jgi:hypothetical protein
MKKYMWFFLNFKYGKLWFKSNEFDCIGENGKDYSPIMSGRPIGYLCELDTLENMYDKFYRLHVDDHFIYLVESKKRIPFIMLTKRLPDLGWNKLFINLRFIRRYMSDFSGASVMLNCSLSSPFFVFEQEEVKNYSNMSWNEKMVKKGMLIIAKFDKPEYIKRKSELDRWKDEIDIRQAERFAKGF